MSGKRRSAYRLSYAPLTNMFSYFNLIRREIVVPRSFEKHELWLKAADIFECATYTFAGLYPVESPYFAWNRMEVLPWFNETLIDYPKVNPWPYCPDVLEIARQLLHAGPRFLKREWPLSGGALTYCCIPEDDFKATVQALAVEALLALDVFLRCLVTTRTFDAMEALSAVYENLLEIGSHIRRPLIDQESERGAAALH